MEYVKERYMPVLFLYTIIFGKALLYTIRHGIHFCVMNCSDRLEKVTFL
jgi:hypothetical protein